MMARHSKLEGRFVRGRRAGQGTTVASRILDDLRVGRVEDASTMREAVGLLTASYLETQTVRNVNWYRSHGFEVRNSEIALTPGGPPNWTMYRPGGRS